MYLEKVITLIINSLGLVAALAWDNAFQKLFRESTVLKNSGPWIYAVMVTFILVGLTILLKNYSSQDNEQK